MEVLLWLARSLVVKTNMDILLFGIRDDLLLLFSLQIGQLFHRLLDDIEGLLDLLFRNDERWREANYVLMRWFRLEWR